MNKTHSLHRPSLAATAKYTAEIYSTNAIHVDCRSATAGSCQEDTSNWPPCHPWNMATQLQHPPRKRNQKHREKRASLKWESSSTSSLSSSSASSSTATSYSNTSPPLSPTVSDHNDNDDAAIIENPKTFPSLLLLRDIADLAASARSQFTLFEYPVWHNLNEIMTLANSSLSYEMGSPLLQVLYTSTAAASTGAAVTTNETQEKFEEIGLSVTDLVLKSMDAVHADPGPLEAFGCREGVEQVLEKILRLCLELRKKVGGGSSKGGGGGGGGVILGGGTAIESDDGSSTLNEKIFDLAVQALSNEDCPDQVKKCLNGILLTVSSRPSSRPTTETSSRQGDADRSGKFLDTETAGDELTGFRNVTEWVDVVPAVGTTAQVENDYDLGRDCDEWTMTNIPASDEAEWDFL